VGYSRETGVPGKLCSLGWECANRSPFTHYKFVISTEGEAEVEKPADKANSTTDLTVKTDEIRTYLQDLRPHLSRSFHYAALRSG